MTELDAVVVHVLFRKEERGWTAMNNAEYGPAELPKMRVEICAMRWMVSFHAPRLTGCVGQGRQSHEDGTKDAHRLEDSLSFMPISRWLLQPRAHVALRTTVEDRGGVFVLSTARCHAISYEWA